MNNWQPIETAPKDGTKILLANKEKFAYAFWGKGVYTQTWVEVHCQDEDYPAMNFEPTHWAEINLPGKETEEQRIVHDLKNYIDYCQYSAIYLSKRAEWLEREHSDEKEEIDRAWKECSEYIMKADPLENIVNNTCLRYKEITKEAVENLWKDRQGHCMFSEIPPEYTKDFYKKK